MRTCGAVLLVLASLCVASPAGAQSLPSGWETRDIGSVGASGKASGSADRFSLDGAGADVWGSSDAFRFTYRRLTGDGAIVAQVSAMDRVAPWTKVGVMMRDTLAANSRHAFMLVSAGKGLAFQRRKQTGGTSYHTGASGGVGRYVKLVRSGDTFRGYTSTDGAHWTLVGSTTIPMADSYYIGFAVSSHVAGVLATGSFEATKIEAGGSATATPPPSTSGSSGSSGKPTPPPPPPPVDDQPASSSGTLRVLHWNTHHGGTGTDGRYDPARLAGFIAKFNPDVVSLNEVETRSQANNIISALESRTGKQWRDSYDDRGNLVLSKLTVTNESICTVNSGAGRKAAHLSLLVSGRPVNVWSAHLAVDSGSARQSEVNALQSCAANWAESRIIAGDFNTQSGSAEIKDMSTTYNDAWVTAKGKKATTNYSGNCDGCTRNSRIDYVFSSKGARLAVKSAQIFDTRDSKGKMASDHKPMLVVYTLQ